MASAYHTHGADLKGLRFTKLEGLGNDFIVVDERARTAPSLSHRARVALCDRHRGVGADGVLTLLAPASPGALCTMHVTNADGSEPEMCGNGIRCVSRWLQGEGEVRAGQAHVIDSGAGPKRCTVLSTGGRTVGEGEGAGEGEGEADGEMEVEVEMGPARLHGAATGDPLIRAPLEAGGETFEATAVSMGNPHLVLLEGLRDFTQVQALGPSLEHYPRFPARTNVGFARLGESDGAPHLELIVWERGCGITQACGTGACAAAVAYVEAGRVQAGRPLAVSLPGGRLVITVSADLTSVKMRGPARGVFSGVLA